MASIRKFVTDIALASGFDDDATNRIVLAVDEACTNIIKHAYHSNPSKPIEIDVISNENRFEIIITDYGDSFKPDAINTNDVKSRIVNYKKGGLGMFLMKSLVDRVEYFIENNKKNNFIIKLSFFYQSKNTCCSCL